MARSHRARFGTFEFDDRSALLTRGGSARRARAAAGARARRCCWRMPARSSAATNCARTCGVTRRTSTTIAASPYSIGQLRAALGDSADNPRFVQTLPRRGFRFIAPVEARGREQPTEAGQDLAEHRVSRARDRPRRARSARGPSRSPRCSCSSPPARWFATRRVPSDRPSRPIIAVAVFENDTGDPVNERAVAGLSDVIVERLTALGTDARRHQRQRQHPAAAPRRAGRAGGGEGNRRDISCLPAMLQKREGQLSLLMQLVRLDDGTHVWVQRIARPIGDPPRHARRRRREADRSGGP